MSWLTKLLGHDEAMFSLTTHIGWLQGENEKKDEEIRRLTNLILIEHGVIHPELSIGSAGKEPQMINRKSSWPQRQRELEKLDKIVGGKSKDTSVDEKEKYWHEKSERAMREAPVTKDQL